MLWIEPAPPEGFPWGQLAAVVAIWLLWLCISRWRQHKGHRSWKEKLK